MHTSLACSNTYTSGTLHSNVYSVKRNRYKQIKNNTNAANKIKYVNLSILQLIFYIKKTYRIYRKHEVNTRTLQVVQKNRCLTKQCQLMCHLPEFQACHIVFLCVLSLLSYHVIMEMNSFISDGAP